MEKNKVLAQQDRLPSIVLRMRHPPRNRASASYIYQQSEIELSHESQKVRFRKGCTQHETNHQTYQRICSNMMSNLYQPKDQLYIFCGEEEERLQSFLGSAADPGMLLVIMVYLLQEKYKHPHNKVEMRVSFIEYTNGDYYDLLASAREPLKIITRTKRCLYGCSSMKLAEYIEFLRLFKIALYNNKSRDFKVNQGKDTNKDSIFMVRVDIAINLEQRLQSSIFLVDFQNDYRKQNSNVKTQWDHLCNFVKSLKRQGDSKAQPGTLTQFLQHYISINSTTLVYCMSSVADKFSINMSKLLGLKEMLNVKRSESYCVKQPKKVVDMPKVENLDRMAEELISYLNKIQFQSVRHLQSIEKIVHHCIDMITQRMRQINNLVCQICLLKARLELQIVTNLSEQKQLIGSSVKSQNIKEFYNSKTYNSLYRQVSIMTEQSSRRISLTSKQLHNLIVKYEKTRRKQCAFAKQLSSLSQGDTVARNVVQKVTTMFRYVSTFYDIKEKEVHCKHRKLWVERVVQKQMIQKSSDQFMGIFRKLQHNLKQLLIDSRCHFKQEKLLSENNIVSKIATKVNSNYSPTTILPRILFKKMDPTYTQNRSPKPMNHFTIKLSDFLTRVKKPGSGGPS